MRHVFVTVMGVKRPESRASRARHTQIVRAHPKLAMSEFLMIEQSVRLAVLLQQ